MFLFFIKRLSFVIASFTLQVFSSILCHIIRKRRPYISDICIYLYSLFDRVSLSWDFTFHNGGFLDMIVIVHSIFLVLRSNPLAELLSETVFSMVCRLFSDSESNSYWVLCLPQIMDVLTTNFYPFDIYKILLSIISL